MIFYRLGLQKIIQYFKLDELFKEEERRLILLRKQPKVIYRTKLRANRAMDLCISILLSIISALVCLSVPYYILESPCEVLKNSKFPSLYSFAINFEKYLKMIDRLIVVLFIILVFVTVKTVIDAINNTDISMSPWVERGKYVLPHRPPKKSRRH